MAERSQSGSRPGGDDDGEPGASGDGGATGARPGRGGEPPHGSDPPAAPPPAPPGALRAWLAWLLLSAALWLALVDRVPLQELAAGAGVAALAASAAVIVRRRRPVLLAPRPRWAGRLLRALAGLAGDLPLLARVLWRRGLLRREPGGGALVEQPFGALDPHDGAQAAERALSLSIGSLAPATVVVDLDEERAVLVSHRLERP